MHNVMLDSAHLFFNIDKNIHRYTHMSVIFLYLDVILYI